MKVLITGGAGFIGSHIVDKLLQDNCNVIVVDNLSSGSLENLPKNFDLNSNFKFYPKDILNDSLSDIFEAEKPDFCIHLAAQTSVVKSVQNPIFDAQMNIEATIKLLEICKKYEIKKFITASSAAVYGTPQYLPIQESHPAEPISNYGLSKLTMEKYIQLSGLDYIIFRFANVYGPRQASSKESGVVAIFNDLMIKNDKINIYGDGEQIRDFVYVEDIAQACLLALKNEQLLNEVINVSTGVGVTINELFNYMKELYNYQKAPNYLSVREGDIKDSILSNERAVNLISGFETTNIKVGIKQLRDFYCKEGINA